MFYLSLYGEVELETSGDLEASLIKYSNTQMMVYEANLNNDLYFKDDYKLATSVGWYSTNKPVFNNNSKILEAKVNAVRLNELYLTRYLGDGWSTSIGQFPFVKGRFHEHNFNGSRKGIGLYTLTDLNMQGAIVTKRFNKNHSVQIGSVAFEKYFRTYNDRNEEDSRASYHDYKDSGMKFISYKYERDEWYFETIATDMKLMVRDHEIANSDTLTFALEYSDEVRTGATYYGLITFSNTSGDNSPLSNSGGHHEHPSDRYGEYKTNGKFYLLGVKKEFDHVLFGKDVVAGVEYMKKEEGYHSLLAGKPLSYESSADLGEVWNTFIGLRLDKSKLLKLKYYRYDSNGQQTKGPYTSRPGDGSGDSKSVGKIDAFILQVYVEF